ncbi:AAA family ATPase [Hydrogenophilus thermoluteolus]|uniref:AAA family ATPase n=1 Tax=Hydrogenophilus thermoluteolus TaxID=297 RepID=UPI003F681FC0
MEKQFNTAGPSKPHLHYMIDPLKRIDLPEVEMLIAQERYFVLHAPRQTGKTTCLLALTDHLNRTGRYRALYANIETAQAARNDVARGITAVASAIARSASIALGNATLDQWLLHGEGQGVAPEELVTRLLTYWSVQEPERPAVLLLDEVDALVGDTLVSLLRQLRAGYTQRPRAFPQSVILCGVRDVRDYRIHTPGQEVITGGSAFNIKAESLRLGNFTFDETKALWLQHTEATGQRFDDAIWEPLWLDTEGQPWLVNALGHECTWKDKTLRADRTAPVTLERYQLARERLIQSRATHLDQLADKLSEPRVHRVIAAILESEADPAALSEEIAPDDLQYVYDLGLIAVRPMVRISNRIYREVIPRELTWTKQVYITHETAWYVDPATHRLQIPKLLTAFQEFFREHSDAWLQGFSYREAGPQLLLQAFLQRIVNGGGRINREYGLGRKRTDLLIEWPLDPDQGLLGPKQKGVIECKLVRNGKNPEAVVTEGIAQVADYADRSGAKEAYLVVFDRRDAIPWEARIWQREYPWPGKPGQTIGVWGM